MMKYSSKMTLKFLTGALNMTKLVFLWCLNWYGQNKPVFVVIISVNFCFCENNDYNLFQKNELFQSI